MLTYWRFYWPLVLTGMAVVLSNQFQNATLARYPNAVEELAVLALAYGVYGFFQAGLQFFSQLANVYARSAPALARATRFSLAGSIILSLPLLAIALLPAGRTFMQLAFDIDPALAGRVADYLLWMTPLVVLNARRHFLTGLLIQVRRSGSVTLFNVVYLALVLAGLLGGFHLGLAPMHVVIGAELAGITALVALLTWARHALWALPATAEHGEVTYKELLAFFVPVSMTGLMFALSRPVLFAFVARSPDGLLTIAALRVAFDFTMLFQQAANQFRHFFITFGTDALAEKRRFMVYVSVGLTVLMGLFVVTPLADLIWGELMQLPEALMAAALQALAVMCLAPAIIVYRNYFHSRLMLARATTGMALGSMARVAGIALGAGALFATGALDPVSAAACLVAGFVVEAAFSQAAFRRASATSP